MDNTLARLPPGCARNSTKTGSHRLSEPSCDRYSIAAFGSTGSSSITAARDNGRLPFINRSYSLIRQVTTNGAPGAVNASTASTAWAWTRAGISSSPSRIGRTFPCATTC
ncbi:hypothetical protein Areg01_76530 [Actinoplanes regularis]|nr:hypothetical protein Areg01_76530 [Actinoplanes regularis]